MGNSIMLKINWKNVFFLTGSNEILISYVTSASLLINA